MIIAHLQGLILHSLKIIQYKMNFFLPSCSLHAPSDARHFPQCPLLHGLTETEPLPIIPMDTVIAMGSEGRPEGSRPWATSLQQSWPDGYTVGQVTSPNGYGVLIGWLWALGKRASIVIIYREESMVTLARTRKGLGGGEMGKEGEKVLAR